jgi:hypothetical protein
VLIFSFVFKREKLYRLTLALAERMTIFAYLYLPIDRSVCWW